MLKDILNDANELRPWQGYQDNGDKIEYSGPLLSQSYGVDELLERNERQIRQLVRKSWFQKGIINMELMFCGFDLSPLCF